MFRRAAAVAVVVSLLLAGCTAGPSGGQPTQAPQIVADSELTLATSRINATVDPAEALTTSYLRSYGAGESLAKIQADGSIEPEFAEKIEQTAPNQWTVTLREGVTFHSGAVVDAAAVVASLERSRAKNELAGNLLKGIAIERLDDRTVTFTAEAPVMFLDATLSHYELQIHNAAAHEAGETAPYPADLTGAFRVTDFSAGREVHLERNPDWWGPAPTVAKITVREVTDPQSRAQIALAGQADIVDMLPPDALAQVEAADEMTLQAVPAANTVAVYLNPASDAAPALADKKVRQALAWAVNRDQVAEIAGEGHATTAPSWLASNPAYPDARNQGFTRHDPALAARLLDEAGWTLDANGRRSRDGRPLTIRLLTWGTEGPTGETLQAQWDALGVDVELSYVDNTLVQQSRQRGDWDAVTAAFTTLGDVPALLSIQVTEGGSGNYGKYDIPEAAPLLAKAYGSESAEERTQAILDLNALMADVVPSIPVHPRLQATAVSTRVQGFVPHPLQYENLVQPAYAVTG